MRMRSLRKSIGVGLTPGLSAWAQAPATPAGEAVPDVARQELTTDGLHPNQAGYDIMGPLAEKAIAAALQAK
jgi:lysophospholipase L1-like esterase